MQNANIFSQLTNLGVDDKFGYEYNRKVVVGNVLAIIAVCISLFLATLFFFTAQTILAVFELIGCVVYIFALYSSYINKPNTGKYVALIFSAIGVWLFMSLIGERKGISLIVFMLSIVPVIVLEARKIVAIAFFVALPLVGFVSFEYNLQALINLPVLADELKEVIYIILVFTATVSISLCVYYIVKQRKNDVDIIDEKQYLINKIADTTPNIIYLFDIERDRFVYLNKRFEEILKLRVSDFTSIGITEIYKFIHPDDLKGILDNTVKLFKMPKGSWVETTYRIKDRSGNYIWTRNRSQVFEYSNDNKVKLVLGITEDISQIVAGQEENTRLLQIQSNILETAPYAIITTNQQGLITVFNKAAEKLFGFTQAEVVGKLSAIAFIPKEEIVSKANSFSQLHSTKTNADFEVLANKAAFNTDAEEWVLTHSNGNKFFADMAVTAIKNSDGSIGGYLLMANDISVRKKSEDLLQEAKNAAEEASKAKSQFLANMGHEFRTPLNGILGMTDLTLNGNLDNEQKEYLSYVKQSGTRLLSVINDILDYSKLDNNDLQLTTTECDLVALVAEVMESHIPNANAKQLPIYYSIDNNTAKGVNADVFRLKQLIGNLLDNAIKFTTTGKIDVSVSLRETNGYADIIITVADTGVGIPTNKFTDIFKPFNQVDESHKRKFQGTGLGLSIVDKLCRVMGGSINLTSSVGKGSTFVVNLKLLLSSSTVSSKAPSKNSLLLLTKNNNLSDAVKTQCDYLGIKYYKANTSIELVGGIDSNKNNIVVIDTLSLTTNIDKVLNEINGGPYDLLERYVLINKLDDSLSTLIKCNRVEGILYGITPQKIKGLFTAFTPRDSSITYTSIIPELDVVEDKILDADILLAEDNEVNLLLEKQVLGKLGYTVNAVTDGKQAVDQISQRPYDLVILDIQMPVMDGVEALKNIRSLDKLKHIHTPVIAITAHAMTGDREIFINEGFDEYITKPFDKQHLADAIKNLITKYPIQKNNNPITTTTMENVETKKVDLAYLEDLLNGNKTAIKEVLGMFIIQTPALLTEMRTAFDTANYFDLSKLAHKLKGTMVAIGVNGNDMQRLKELELKALDAKTGDALVDLLALSEKNMMAIVDEMKVYLHKMEIEA